MYDITLGEHPDFRIPYLQYRGTPTGIDVLAVASSGIRPVMDIGVAGRNGGQIGAGFMRAPIPCFEAAAEAYSAAYPDEVGSAWTAHSNGREGITSS
jgi:hypothetical protein